jgi:hypothetical protein
VSYWNNTSLFGEPIISGTEADINFDWGRGSPHTSIAADNFSARWQRYIDVTAGTYRFTARSDDGIRIYVDNRLVLNQWNDHSVLTFTVDVSLTAGHHQIVVEYYEHTGFAVAQVSWALAPVTIYQWQGEYFNNGDLSGSPAMIRDDSQISFDWGYGSPSSLVADNFSIRWTRTIYLSAGTYRFTTTTDDGVRLWVNGHLLINKWQEQAIRSHSNTIFVSGNVPIKMEYYEKGGLATARLNWARVNDGPPPPPPPPPPPSGSIFVDDLDAGFVKGGYSRAWRTANEGQSGHMTWTWNNDRLRNNYNWGRWYPNLAARRYELFVFIPDRFSTTSNARYWISHRDGYTLRAVNQAANGGRWVSLGTYWFQGNSSDYVSLADITFETHVSCLIAFDTVRWDPR